MAKMNKLEEEIRAMEEGLFSNPSEDDAAEEQNEVDDNNNEVSPETDEIQEPASNDDDADDASEVELETVEDAPFQEKDKADDTSEVENATDESTTTDKPQNKRTNWKKRFTNLKATHDSTVSKLRVDLSQSLSANAKLEKVVNELRGEIQELKESSVDIYKGAFSEEEVDILGEDTVSSLKKATKLAVENAVTPLRDQLSEERQLRIEALEREASNQATQANSVFLQKLGDLVPDYVELDTNHEFLSWMSGVDQYSGSLRKDLFKQAQAVGDVERVASFFNAFKKTKSKGKKILERKVTPEATSSSSNQKVKQHESKPVVIDREYIDNFYNAAIKGKFKGREKERLEIERNIDQAIMDGRVAL